MFGYFNSANYNKPNCNAGSCATFASFCNTYASVSTVIMAVLILFFNVIYNVIITSVLVIRGYKYNSIFAKRQIQLS